MTPYTGGNLGDGAIQEAVIQNIRSRLPDAEIVGITLRPRETERLHGIPCYPLASFSIPFYGPGSTCTPSPANRQQKKHGATSIAAETGSILKRLPIAGQLMKKLYEMSKLVLTEMGHIIASYKLSKRLDLLIVSGGGQLDDYWGGPWGHPYALLKWSLLARIGRATFVVLSVGTCTFDSKLSKLFIRCALAAASYRSYRDEASKNLLSHIGFVRNDLIYPDLAFSYSVPRVPSKSRQRSSQVTVGISPIAYLHPRRWPKGNPDVYDSYIKELLIFVSSLIEQRYSIMFFWTDGSDRQSVNELITILNRRLAPGLKERISQAPSSDLNGLFTHLSRVDWAVASRLHGILLSHLAGKPVLGISYDRKVDVHMDDMDQSAYCLDINRLDAALLLERFRLLTINTPFIKSTIARKINERRHRLEAQYDFVLGTGNGEMTRPSQKDIEVRAEGHRRRHMQLN